MKATSLSVVLALLSLACSDSSAPRPVPAPTAPPDAGADGLRPLSSRDSGPAGTATPGGAPTGELPPGHPPIEGMAPSTGPDGSADSASAVSGTITLADSLASALLPSDVLYVMAKKDGATLAVRRVDAPRFPFSFDLGGADAMVAGTDLSGPVDIVVRVSKTGDAIPSAGDLEGTTSGVAVPSSEVAVTIDQVRE